MVDSVLVQNALLLQMDLLHKAPAMEHYAQILAWVLHAVPAHMGLTALIHVMELVAVHAAMEQIASHQVQEIIAKAIVKD